METDNKGNVHFKMELKRGSKGNLLVIVKFNPDTSNFTQGNLTWCPTLAELDMLSEAREKIMENRSIHVNSLL